ncbi:hypothetical protein EDC04DRAFT_3149997 [Pisolithus marmoratus]|nr:hypothetical protein EDC04DRAFT_3149997 [Pisolithus marmoratus]
MAGVRHDVIQLLSEHLSADTELNINPPVDCSIRLSQEVLAFLAKENIDPFELLQEAAVCVPFVDDTLPLRNYFVSFVGLLFLRLLFLRVSSRKP